MDEQEPSKQRDGEYPDKEPQTVEQHPGIRPRIYAASLSDYVDGILHGAWLDAAVEPDELLEGVRTMLAKSPTAKRLGQPAEEWAIHDFTDFGPLRLGEYESTEWVTAVARGIAEHGEAFAAWADQVGGDREALSRFDDVYLGQWDSIEEYAESFLDDLGIEADLDKLDPWVRSYVQVDYAGFARDLAYGGDVTAVERPAGGVWLFDARQ